MSEASGQRKAHVLEADTLSPVIPSDDLVTDARRWETILGVAPTFVDGDRWAQFDVGSRRLALGGSDRITDRPSVMVRAADLDAAQEHLQESGFEVSRVEQGPDERRFLASAPWAPWDLIVYRH